MPRSVFDYINSINEKNYIYDELDRGYNEYVINKGLSYFPDTILLVNEANRLRLKGKAHYDFLYHTIARKKRFSKWFKGAEGTEDLEAVMEFYDINMTKAQEYLEVLSEDDLVGIRKKLEKGGISK